MRLSLGENVRVELGVVLVVGPFDHRDLGTRRIERASAYTVHADGSLEVSCESGVVHFDFDEWADVKFDPAVARRSPG